MDTTIQGTDDQTKRELQHAVYAALTSRAGTDAANRLVDTLCEQVSAYEVRQGKRSNQRKKKAPQFRMAVEGLLADLLRAQTNEKAKGWVYRSLRTGSFTGGAVWYKKFIAVGGIFLKTGLVYKKGGYEGWKAGFSPRSPKTP